MNRALALVVALCCAAALSVAPAATPPVQDARFADDAVRAQVLRRDGKAALRIETATGHHTVDLGSAVQRVAAMRRHQARLVVLGRIAEGGATEVCIVDLANGRVVDRFWGYDPAVSPDASMVAFVRFYPLHFTPGVESQYRLYRVGDTAAANRSYYKGQAEGIGEAAADAGQPILAVEKDAHSRAPRDNFQVPDAQAHEHLSQLAWSPDGSRVAVLDAQGKAIRALVAQVRGDAAATLARPVDGMEKICRTGRKDDDCTTMSFDAVSLQFDAAGAALLLQISDKSLFPRGYARTLPLTSFAALR